MEEEMRSYLVQRFNKNNHPKYRKYCMEWVENVTDNQMMYFKEEEKRRNDYDKRDEKIFNS